MMRGCARAWTAGSYAQELLLWHGVSVALNVKSDVMGRVAHATGAIPVASTGELTAACVGTCARFGVEMRRFDKLSPTKSLMFFEGPPHPMCATVLLEGPNVQELTQVKQLLFFALFAAYHQVKSQTPKSPHQRLSRCMRRLPSVSDQAHVWEQQRVQPSGHTVTYVEPAASVPLDEYQCVQSSFRPTRSVESVERP
jgi:hypothetical protein